MKVGMFEIQFNIILAFTLKSCKFSMLLMLKKKSMYSLPVRGKGGDTSVLFGFIILIIF